MLAATVRVTRDLDTAEEAVQDAYVQALQHLGARRRARPARRLADHRGAAQRPQPGAAAQDAGVQAAAAGRARGWDDARARLGDPNAIPDDRLRLIFTCCHPALAPEAQVALTLRLVCGVATPDIARAFLVADATMAARLTRAKKKIAAARIPYAVPSAAELPARVDAALTVVHLLYATGHTAPSGDDLVRDDLCDRALDLARLLRRLLPDEREVAGLLALLLVHHARRATRTDARRPAAAPRGPGPLRPGTTIVDRRGRPPGGGRAARRSARAVHAAGGDRRAARPGAELRGDRLAPDPGAVRRAAAGVAVARGRPQPGGGGGDGRRPEAALAEVEALEGDGRLAGYRYLPATKADLLHRLGRDADAVEAYREALALTGNAAEQEFLTDRLRSAQATA